MIVISGVLVVLALVLLIAGVLADSLPLIYLSIATSAISFLSLVFGVRQRKDEHVPSSASAGAGSRPVDSSPRPAGSVALLERLEEPPAPERSAPVAPTLADTATVGGAHGSTLVDTPAAGTHRGDDREADSEQADEQPAPASQPAPGEVEQEPAAEAVEEYDDEDYDYEGYEEEASEGVVLVINGRPRYHIEGCRFVAGKDAEAIAVEDAREEGFTACGVCRPDEALAAAAEYYDDEDEYEADELDQAEEAEEEAPAAPRAVAVVPGVTAVAAAPAQAPPGEEELGEYAEAYDEYDDDDYDEYDDEEYDQAGHAEAEYSDDEAEDAPVQEGAPYAGETAGVTAVVDSPVVEHRLVEHPESERPVVEHAVVEPYGVEGDVAEEYGAEQAAAEPADEFDDDLDGDLDEYPAAAAVAPGPEPVAPPAPESLRARRTAAAEAGAQPGAGRTGARPSTRRTAGARPAAARPGAPRRPARAAAPAPVPDEVPAPPPRTSARGRVVVIPDRGRFHRPECRYVRDSPDAIEITKNRANKQGYVPCGVCKP